MHHALAVEHVGDRAGVRQRAAVAGHRRAHLHGGAVPVVGEALDQERHAVGPVALVHDRGVVRAAGLGAGPALDGPVDVVVGDRGLLGLLDGVVERRVARDVTAAHPGGDLDVLDQLGEHLAAPGVDDGLLVLGRRPLGVARHQRVPSLQRCFDEVAEEPVDASVPPHLGVEGRRHQVALPDRDDPTRGLTAGRRGRAPRPPAPTASTHGARMKTACTGCVETGEVEVALEGVDLAPERVAADGDVETAEGLLVGGAVLDPVGEQDHPGAGAEGRHPVGDPLAAAARSSSKIRASLAIVVDSPPGITSPSQASSSAGRRTARASQPSPRRTARCSRTSPCSASTPILGWSTPPA